MVMKALKLGWRTKPKVETNDYVQELSTILKMVASPNSHDASDLAIVLAALRRFESVSPQDARLGDVHVRAIGYVRGFLKVEDLRLTWQQKIANGNRNAASKDFTAIKQWQATLEEVTMELIQSLRVLSSTHPDLYRQIDVPASLR